jgi:uncharacterized protein YxjI
MEYPLNLSFKIMALATQISVKDANGAEVCYVKQKMFKLKEKVTVFTDSTQSQTLCEIGANKILDFSAAYTFTGQDGQPFGNVKRQGMRSLFKSHYDVAAGDQAAYTVTEGNPMAKVFDSILGEIPVIGLLTGYMFHPRFDVTDLEGNVCYQMTKQPAFLEGKFILEETISRDDDFLVLIALLMIVLLERRKG